MVMENSSAVDVASRNGVSVKNIAEEGRLKFIVESGKYAVASASEVVPEHVFRSVCEKVFPIVQCIERDYAAPIVEGRLAFELLGGINRVLYLRKLGRELSEEEERERPWEDFMSVGGRQDYPVLKYTDEEFTALQGLSHEDAGILLARMLDVVCGFECITEEQARAFVKVERDGLCLKDVSRQTYCMCLCAVRQNGFALQFVKRPTVKIIQTAMKQIMGSVTAGMEAGVPQVTLTEALKEMGGSLAEAQSKSSVSMTEVIL